MRLSLILAAALFTAASAAAQPRTEAYKKEVIASVDGMAKMAQEMVDSVFSFGELGHQEVETSRYLTAILEKNGFTIRRGIAGMPTAWVATWGSGKPVIALGSDIDGIPQASQKPGVAYRAPMIEGAPGHGEGHNSGHAAQHRRGHRREADHGARQAAGHADALARRRRGAARVEGLVRPRRRLQGRGHLPVRARGQQLHDRLGIGRAATASCRWSTRSRARAPTAPARRGGAAARSTRSS